jgi:hypothetical protein
MAIYSQYGSKVEIISQISKDDTVWIKRSSDGTEFNVPTLSLKADGGIQEIQKAAKAYEVSNVIR